MHSYVESLPTAFSTTFVYLQAAPPFSVYYATQLNCDAHLVVRVSPRDPFIK